MNAREKILGKIRHAQSLAGTTSHTESIATYLAHHPRGPLPQDQGDLVARFKDRALKLSSDILETNNNADIPNLLATYLKERNLPISGACWPSLGSFAWSAAGLNIGSHPAKNTDLVGVTGAFCAIAETGTLMMLSGPQTPATTSLLPETHVAVLDPKRIVATMEDAWDLLRREHKQAPRAVNFISGPSRTADIEQTVTLGAHGPYRVLIILATLKSS